MSEWQPIKTAPRDEETSYFVCWNEPKLGWQIVIARRASLDYAPPEEWVVDMPYGTFSDGTAAIYPTHWMPLPAPPEEN